jgi:hypothetical protein
MRVKNVDVGIKADLAVIKDALSRRGGHRASHRGGAELPAAFASTEKLEGSVRGLVDGRRISDNLQCIHNEAG